MAKVDFSAILGASVGSAPQPKNLPQGVYYGIIDGIPVAKPRSTKEGDKGVLTVKISLNEADADVDEAELAEAGGLVRNDGRPRQVMADFWLTEDAMYRLDNFMAGFGFNAESGKSYGEALEELDGRNVTVSLKHRTYTDRSGTEKTAVDIDRCFATENAA